MVVQGARDKGPDWMVTVEVEKVVVATERGDGLDLGDEGEQRPGCPLVLLPMSVPRSPAHGKEHTHCSLNLAYPCLSLPTCKSK